MDTGKLESTREFWDFNPCGVHEEFEAQRAHRYAMEPWIKLAVEAVARQHGNILEVGCGQGVDSITMCTAMQPGGRYIGIDYSPNSVAVAQRNAQVLAAGLSVQPSYQVGNAEKLDFPDNTFEAVVSVGVIHHTFDDAAAIREVYRVLKPGGTAAIFLYRKPAPKVLVAKALRGLQWLLDRITGRERCLYRLLAQHGSYNRLFGTMFHECFGVPYMKWYTAAGIRRLFAPFGHDVSMVSIGPNLGRLLPPSWGEKPSKLGYFWAVTATKR